jgi:hypothetical protein
MPVPHCSGVECGLGTLLLQPMPEMVSYLEFTLPTANGLRISRQLPSFSRFMPGDETQFAGAKEHSHLRWIPRAAILHLN